MTPNDQQIDLLIRRFAKAPAAPAGGADHLDADELSAFAEGALPAAARARYVSHLADCDQCRRQVADLAIASGAMTRVGETIAQKPERRNFWATLFGPRALRYGAVAAILVIVAGVAFIALRRRSNESELIAVNEQAQQKPFNAVNPASETNGGTTQTNNGGVRAPSLSQTPPASTGQSSTNPEPLTREETKAPDLALRPEPAKEAATEKKTESLVTQSQQSYAPAPPGEAQSGGRSQSQTQSQSGFGQLSGGAAGKVQAADKTQSEDRERDAKDLRLDDRAHQSNQPQVAATRRPADEKQRGGPSRNMDNVAINNRNSNEVATAPKKSDGSPASVAESSQTRSVGGRKFMRQGNAWVDQKFKSSMAIKTISRSSDEFAALDGGLRSIAQQLGGEIIVVWKGKAYRIQ
ncbi:MAG TPA: zf-HC2 domain-containing protein [Pyrinomonadaceae bacterium]|nr:zf-HC2 domain-containing protein [Pyrinomonadaceae bacterium]